MLRRHRTGILLAALLGVALAVYFEPSHCVRGLLWGEAFFDGRPTSYWRAELERWHAEKTGWGEPSLLVFSRTPTFFEKVMGWLPRSQTDEEALEEAITLFVGPRVLRHKEAVPVLLELRDDPSPKIREFARYGLHRLPVE